MLHRVVVSLLLVAVATPALAQEPPRAEARPTDGADADAPDTAGAPADGEARATWMADLLERIVAAESQSEREKLAEQLVDADKDGDCAKPLVELIPEREKDADFLVPLVRALGRDGLFDAAPAVAELLGHKEDAVRGNAAVTLEYIGSRDKDVVSALKKQAGREKDEAIANHVYRALGRCGVEDAKARSTLLKVAAKAKSEFASYGPSIGLAYFEGDEKAARGVEKILKVMGVPGSRRGGGQNAVKRGLVSWVLAEIGDPKSAPFVDEELIARLEHMNAPWVAGLEAFWKAVSRVCAGDKGSMPAVKLGVRGFVRFTKMADLQRYGAEDRDLMDQYRKGRKKDPEFEPKGDNLLNDAGGGAPLGPRDGAPGGRR